jgi:hypothetical protein
MFDCNTYSYARYFLFSSEIERSFSMAIKNITSQSSMRWALEQDFPSNSLVGHHTDWWSIHFRKRNKNIHPLQDSGEAQSLRYQLRKNIHGCGTDLRLHDAFRAPYRTLPRGFEVM